MFVDVVIFQLIAFFFSCSLARFRRFFFFLFLSVYKYIPASEVTYTSTNSCMKEMKNLFRSFVDQDDSMISMRLKSVFVGQRCFSNSKLSIIEFVVFFALFSYLDAFVKHKRIASLLPRTLPFPNKNSSWTI